MIKEYTNDQLLTYLKSTMTCLPYAKGITGFVLNHNYKEIFEKTKEYLDLRNTVIKKYGEVTDDGTYEIIDDEQLEKANAELADYGELKVSVDIIKIPEEKTVESNLTAAQLMSLSWMIKSNTADDIRSILCIPDYDEDEEETKTADKYDPKEPVTDDRFV